MTYDITAPADPGGAYDAIWAPLLAFNQAQVGQAEGRPFALTLSPPGDASVHGGLWGLSLWGSFYIALVVVPEDARGRGLRRELMARAEAEARLRDCRELWLDTYAFQARPFYEALGFTVFGQLDGPAQMFPRWFLRKALD